LEGGSLKSEVICSTTWLLKLFRWLASFCCSVFDVKNVVAGNADPNIKHIFFPKCFSFQDD
jgi:hypothetical protein